MSNPSENRGMSMIVKTISTWTTGFILVYGIYVILYGHLSPGGGFSGGVIAAGAFVLIILAEGQETAAKTLSEKIAETWDSLGALLFWMMAVIGILVAGIFFDNFWATPESAHQTLASGGIIPICNIGIGLKVCCSLYLIAFCLTAYRLRHKPDGKEDQRP